jgi:hypothetical protein
LGFAMITVPCADVSGNSSKEKSPAVSGRAG